METRDWYRTIAKPRWSPPAWVFAPVWTVLYIIIAISYGYMGYLFFAHQIPLMVALPFALNLIFNLAYSPIQFGLRNFLLASADILLILATLAWALLVAYPFAPWVALANIPYLLWVCFAAVLQLTITGLNRT